MEDKLRVHQWLYLLFVFSLPLTAQFSFNLGGAAVQITDLLFIAAAIAWAIATRRDVISWDTYYLLLAGYAVAVTLSAIGSVDPPHSSVKLIGKFYLIGIAFLTFNIVRSVDMLRRVLRAVVLGTTVALLFSLLGIILFYAGLRDPSINIMVHPGYGSLPAGNYPRIDGFFLFPAILCNFLSVAWMAALALRSSHWMSPRMFWLFGAALFIVDLFTLTPGLGGIFLATGLFLYAKAKGGPNANFGSSARSLGALIGAGFLLSACVTLFAYDPLTAPAGLFGGDISPSPRVYVLGEAIQTFLHDPLLGAGIGMPVANVAFTDPTGENHLLADAHNTYLSTLAESGVFGFLTFWSIAGYAVFALLKRKPPDSALSIISLCLLLAMVDAVFYQSLTGSYEDMRHLWLVFGLAASVGTQAGSLRVS